MYIGPWISMLRDFTPQCHYPNDMILGKKVYFDIGFKLSHMNPSFYLFKLATNIIMYYVLNNYILQLSLIVSWKFPLPQIKVWENQTLKVDKKVGSLTRGDRGKGGVPPNTPTSIGWRQEGIPPSDETDEWKNTLEQALGLQTVLFSVVFHFCCI